MDESKHDSSKSWNNNWKCILEQLFLIITSKEWYASPIVYTDYVVDLLMIKVVQVTDEKQTIRAFPCGYEDYNPD
jgi:hypothetical protein